MRFAKTPVVGKMKNAGKVAKKTVLVAFATIPLLLAPSCQNDRVGVLLKERAYLEWKIDSVGKVYQKKKDSLEFTAKYQYEPILTYMKDKLGEEEKTATEPLKEDINNINKEIRTYNVLGRPVFGKPSK